MHMIYLYFFQTFCYIFAELTEYFSTSVDVCYSIDIL